ncbi:MAG: M48 family metallopeptidase [Microcystaceae cyanobacterium]
MTHSYQMTIDDITIDVIKKDIKNLNIRIYPPDGRVRIASPLRIDEKRIREFAISKLSWIKQKRAKFQNKPRQSHLKYVSGETHYFQGHPYKLNIIYHHSAPKVIIRNESYLDLYIKHGSNEYQIASVLLSWYRQQLNQLIPPLIKKWQPIIGVKINEYRIKRMKTRWGTCNIQAKRIWLNLELIKKPPHCLEYVVVHELVHLLERYHNERFYNYMSQFMPNWKFHKEELNQGYLNYEY